MSGATPQKKPRLRAVGPASRRAQYLTPLQVADRLLVAPVTVRLWANRGLLPYETTPGGHRRFREEDVEQFAARRRPNQENAAPSRMLVIDDDMQYAKYLTDLLAARVPGLTVDTAPDSFHAGMKCESLRPDIVTIDLQMRTLDGLEVCRVLRDLFGPDKPRIVVLTGFLSEENAQRILAAGANAWVPKTAPPEKLLEELGIPVAIADLKLAELSNSSQSTDSI